MDEALSRVLYESTRNLFRPVLNTFLICRPQEGGCPDGLDPSLEPGYYMIQFPIIFQPRIRPIPVDKDNIPNEITITLTNFQNYVAAKARDKAFYRQWCTDYIAKQLVLWEEVSKEMGLHKETRRQFKLYDKYLEVWDLVQQKGKHWTEIAKVVYPKDFISESEQLESEYEPNPESAVEKVQQHYKTACELIRNAMRFRDPIVGVLTGEDALQE